MNTNIWGFYLDVHKPQYKYIYKNSSSQTKPIATS